MEQSTAAQHFAGSIPARNKDLYGLEKLFKVWMFMHVLGCVCKRPHDTGLIASVGQINFLSSSIYIICTKYSVLRKLYNSSLHYERRTFAALVCTHPHDGSSITDWDTECQVFTTPVYYLGNCHKLYQILVPLFRIKL